MADKLLPCPFCGNKEVKEIRREHFEFTTLAIECSKCRTRGPEYLLYEFNNLHILWWNTREGK